MPEDERQEPEDEQRQAETPEEFDENFDPEQARDVPPPEDEEEEAPRRVLPLEERRERVKRRAQIRSAGRRSRQGMRPKQYDQPPMEMPTRGDSPAGPTAQDFGPEPSSLRIPPPEPVGADAPTEEGQVWGGGAESIVVPPRPPEPPPQKPEEPPTANPFAEENREEAKPPAPDAFQEPPRGPREGARGVRDQPSTEAAEELWSPVLPEEESPAGPPAAPLSPQEPPSQLPPEKLAAIQEEADRELRKAFPTPGGKEEVAQQFGGKFPEALDIGPGPATTEPPGVGPIIPPRPQQPFPDPDYGMGPPATPPPGSVPAQPLSSAPPDAMAPAPPDNVHLAGVPERPPVTERGKGPLDFPDDEDWQTAQQEPFEPAAGPGVGPALPGEVELFTEPESSRPAAPTPPVTVAPEPPPSWEQNVFDPNVAPPPATQQDGQAAGGESSVNVLKDILSVLGEIKDATNKNTDELRSLKDSLEGVGTYGP